ncbi:MAG: hypothetical protein ACJA2C_000767 [Marinoscillum sp.]
MKRKWREVKNVSLRNAARNIRRMESIVKNAQESNLMSHTETHIVFATQHSAILQDDNSASFLLKIGDVTYVLNRFGFASFRRKIKEINLVDMIATEHSDVEILFLPEMDKFIILDIHQLIELKELFAGACAMLELNAFIHKGICRKTIHT